ncbi:acyltransferase family protein [Cylindrospermum sp. FACHB-282]|uniref:acyltransferase family protein n=1 Tax=Cylindrospermum sp. FACHB-282 TaxID=2692794 RepID=UPI001683385E|nr:acyltransferase [Cylindrospermum sp. FACHB-282]MBD2388000.1 acyltransferase [Cylindrospermum sp. FACHB-282]
MKPNNRLDALLALRAFACLMVVILHSNPPRNSIIYRGYDLSWLIFSHGWVAVWIFFVLSGYLMGKAFYAERYTADVPGVINFWRNRFVRIVPLYYFSILILTILVYPNWLKIENWGYLLRLFTFTYEFSVTSQPGMNFNVVFWSLSTEVQFYILVPFIFSYFKQRFSQPRQIYIAGILIFLLSLAIRFIFWVSLRREIGDQFTYVVKYWYTPLLTNLDLLLCGFLVNPWLKYKPFKLKPKVNDKLYKIFHLDKVSKKHVAVILIVILYLFTAYYSYHQELTNLPERAGKGIRTATTFFILPPVTALITSFFVWAFESDIYDSLSKNENLSFSTILRNPFRILEVFGNISYGVYIWHKPIIENITPIFTSNIPIEAFYARLTAAIILSTLLATVTYYLVELPSAGWKIYQRTDQ